MVPVVTANLKRAALLRSFHHRIAEFLELAEPISPEMLMVQRPGVPEASPGKWHIMHSCAWFWEAFVLNQFQVGYKPYNPILFRMPNSYYESLGYQIRPRNERSTGRPTMGEVLTYVRIIESRLDEFVKFVDEALWEKVAPVLFVGTQHLLQHRELFLTDLLVALNQTPFEPMDTAHLERFCIPEKPDYQFGPETTLEFPLTEVEIGLSAKFRYPYKKGVFGWPNEYPQHRRTLSPFRICTRLVNNRQYLEFINAGGYTNRAFWSQSGWRFMKSRKLSAPMNWVQIVKKWFLRSFKGTQPLPLLQPVSNISKYEAQAFCKWLSKKHPELGKARLPTEFELEFVSNHSQIEDMYGVVWQWTKSPFNAYPGFKPFPGILGEYDGKFVNAGNYVLKGSSIATFGRRTSGTERNYWPPETRTQFAGFRVAWSGRAPKK